MHIHCKNGVLLVDNAYRFLWSTKTSCIEQQTDFSDPYMEELAVLSLFFFLLSMDNWRNMHRKDF